MDAADYIIGIGGTGIVALLGYAYWAPRYVDRRAADAAAAVHRAGDEGAEAGLRGLPASANPYPAGSYEHRAWAGSHEVGALELEESRG